MQNVHPILPHDACHDTSRQYNYTQPGGSNNKQYNAQTINQIFGEHFPGNACCVRNLTVTTTRKCKSTATASIYRTLPSR